MTQHDDRLKDIDDALDAVGASCSHWLWSTDTEHRVTYLSDGFRIATGLDPRPLIGKKRGFAGPQPSDAAVWQRHQQDLDAHRPFQDLTCGFIDADGRLRYVSTSGRPVFAEDGAFLGYRGMAVNVTKQIEQQNYTRLVERAKAESDRRVKAIFDSVETFVFLMLIDGTVVEANRAALVFRGLAREQVTGEPIWDGPWFGDQTPALAAVSAAAERAAQGEPALFELDMSDIHDRDHRFTATCRPVLSASGEVQYVLLEMHDITEAVRMQERNRQLELEMMQNQKLESLGTLAGGIAHEINTPVQYIGDNLKFVRDSFVEVAALLVEALDGTLPADPAYLVSEIPVALTEALEGVERVRQIVGAIKDFSYPDTGHKAWTDLARAIETTATVTRNQWKYVAELHFEPEPDMPLVFCELGEINQVILNLIVNAAQAIEMREDGIMGRIGVTLKHRGAWAEIAVADSGIGIPPEHRDKIFNLFFTTKPPGRGTGQGLAITQSIVVRKHGGRIEVESEPGKGTVFRVLLPIAGTAEERADADMAS